ncbi:acyl-CoA dehydrogenase family protein [Thermodesulfobacteriota bacterium]
MELRIEDFNLPEELESYYEAVREFTVTDLYPLGEEIEDKNRIPDTLLPMLGRAGLLSLRVPKEYGGSGLNMSQFWPILKEVAKSQGAIRMAVHGHNGIWTMIYYHGTKEQKEKYLPLWAKGVGFPVFALTEPERGTGVDIGTTATREGDVYKLNGSKQLITWPDIGFVFHIVAYTGDRSLRAKGISMILAEPGAAGLTIEPHEEFMGIRGCYHGILHFKDCAVPVTNLLGEEGDGLGIALRTFLDVSRLGIAVSCLGAAERLLELSADFAKKRVTFGKPIAERQAVQQMLADMATDIYATRCMVVDCASRYDAGQSIASEASKCKLFAVEMSKRVSDNALMIHGGIGCTREYPVSMIYRDMRELWFEEGTPTIQRLVIGRDVLGKPLRSIGK